MDYSLTAVDVFNRFPEGNDMAHTVHVMKYIFPRQFGLHNVFTSIVDQKETVQPLKDYTLREQEIALKDRRAKRRKTTDESATSAAASWLPRRLRGETLRLVQKWQVLHSRCSYHELLKYYCPVEASLCHCLQKRLDFDFQ